MDYRLWLQTMYAQFGQKWAKLHHGPLWSVAPSMQSELSESGVIPPTTTTRRPILKVKFAVVCLFLYYKLLILQAKVNIPLLSESTIRRDIAAGGISLTSELQVCFTCITIL